jgi:DinB superfamily
MTQLSHIHQRSLSILRQSMETIENIFQTVSREAATTYRDGSDGWTALEVLCHLRDCDVSYQQQAEMISAEENPTLPHPFDHEAAAIERAYNEQDIGQTMTALKTSRQYAIDFYDGLSGNQWSRVGQHRFFGEWTITDNLTFISWHDVSHIEQITRILIQAK